MTFSFEEVSGKDGWPPSRNGMPDLGDRPDDLLLRYIVAPDRDSVSPALHWLIASFARLADKAVREYRAASEQLTAFVENPQGVESVEGHTSLMRAIDHLENCIDAVRRAEGFFSAQTFKDVTTHDQQEMLKTLHKGVRHLRNSIQHAEEDLASSRVPEGEPVFPVATSDGIYFASHYVFYAELGALVIMVWELAAGSVEAFSGAAVQ